MALDIHTLNWNDEILGAAGINAALLPKVAASGTPVGILRAEIAKELGLPKTCRVISGGHDQVCAAFGSGVVSGGEAADGIGTVECITAVFHGIGDTRLMAENGYACVPYVTKENYCTYAFNYSGGALLKWFRDKLGRETAERLKASGNNFYTYFDERIGDDPSGLLVLPHFSGAATPYMDTHSVGAIVGITMDTNRDHIYRALLEGSTYEMRLNAELLSKTGIRFTNLIASGGGANSKTWLQIKADIMGVPIIPLQSSEAGICGCAMLAASALGSYNSNAEIKQTFVHYGAAILPDRRRMEQYDKLFQKYKKMYPNIKEIITS
jgi:xylulokinase